MKKYAPPVLVLLVAAVALSFSTAATWAGQPPTAGQQKSQLDGLSTKELIDVVDKRGNDPDRAQAAIEKLWEGRKGADRRELMSVLVDKNRQQDTRAFMVDLLAGNPEEAQLTGDVRGLLNDDRLNSELKSRILVSYKFDTTDSALLSALSMGGDDDVAFHALKKLGQANPGRAREIVLGIIGRGKASSDAELSASYKVLIRNGKLDSDPETRKTLVKHLRLTVNDAGTSPQLLDSATFALADMKSLDALRILLDSKVIARTMAAGAVDENAHVIKAAIEGDPSQETIELAIDAMELHPIADLAAPLMNVRCRVQSPALLKRLDAVLALISSDGIAMNPRWTED